MKAIDQYFPVVLLTMLYKAILTSESVDEILECDHSYMNQARLSRSTFMCCCFVYQSFPNLNFGELSVPVLN